MKWIDSHTHLAPYFQGEALEKAIEGILEHLEFIIEVAIDEASQAKVIKLTKEYPFVFGTQGYHPSNANEFDLATGQEKLSQSLQQDKVVAVGEIGLDFKHPVDESLQKKVFEKQLEVATQLKLPVVIHNRFATEEVLSILKPYPVLAIFHCFAGSVREGLSILEQGHKLSFSGIITFKNKTDELKELLKQIPLDSFLIETDCPYLTPEPFRGKQNMPHYVQYVGEFIASYLDVEPSMLRQQLYQNTTQFFKLPSS